MPAEAPKFLTIGNSNISEITQRQYYAAKAMQGLLVACSRSDMWPKPELIAEKAVEMANALIDEIQD